MDVPLVWGSFLFLFFPFLLPPNKPRPLTIESPTNKSSPTVTQNVQLFKADSASGAGNRSGSGKGETMERTRESEVGVLHVRVEPVSCTVLSGGGQTITHLWGRISLTTFQCLAGSVNKTRTARGGEGPMREKPAYFKQVGPRSLGVSGE